MLFWFGGMLIFVSIMSVVVECGPSAEARTPARHATQERVAPVRLHLIDAPWIYCAPARQYTRACFIAPDLIQLGSEGRPWLRHELRHKADWDDDGILNGSICGPIPRGLTMLQWSEACAGKPTP